MAQNDATSGGTWDAAERWREVGALYERCLEVPPHERESLLLSLAESRPDLAAEVRELLELDPEPGLLTRESSALDLLNQHDWTESNASEKVAHHPHYFLWRRALRGFFVLVNMAVLLVYCAALRDVSSFRDTSIDYGWYADPTPSGWQVTSVDATGPAWEKLQFGDSVEAVNGRGTGLVSLPAALRAVAPGAQYGLRVRRGGAPVDLTLPKTIALQEHGATDGFTFALVSACFLVPAVLLSLLKPEQRSARLGYAALLLVGLVTLHVSIRPYAEFVHGTWLGMYTVLAMFDGVHLAVAYHFYVAFFDQLEGRKRRDYVRAILFAWAAPISLSRPITLGVWNSSFVNQHLDLLRAVELCGGPFYFVAPLAICLLIAIRNRSVTLPDSRLRARWIVAGSLAGLMPYAGFRLLSVISLYSGTSLAGYNVRVIYRLCLLATAMIPATTTYAILKHRAFDIEVVIRRGLQYILLKRVLHALVALPAIGLVVSLITNSQSTVEDALWHNRLSASLMLFFGSVLLLRSRLTRWLDRKFFREGFDVEKIVMALGESAPNAASAEQFARTLGAQVEAALHPRCLLVLLADSRREWLRTAYDSQGSAPMALPARAAIISALDGQNRGQFLAILRHSVSESRDLDRLASRGIELMIPVQAKTGRMAGMLLLGSKLSEEGYTQDDRKKLGALARQIAIAHENEVLQRRIQDERIAPRKTGLVDSDAPALVECRQCRLCFDRGVSRCPAHGDTLMFTLPVPRVIDGRFRLDRMIGKGAMGSVYQAQDLKLHRPVAIKIIRTEASPSPTAVIRAHREAIAAARLNHPNIVAAYDFDEKAPGLLCLFMEYIPGDTLRVELAKGLPDPRVAAEWFDQILQGLSAAHAAGIVHRDLKPENILIARAAGGRTIAKILDFGIAKLEVKEEAIVGQFEPRRGPDSPTTPSLSPLAHLTQDGSVLGSMRYMSPEQMKSGATADERSDLFAVGLMIFEALSGHVPFDGDTKEERLLSLKRPLLPLPTYDANGAALNETLRKCLAIQVEQRFRSASELRAAIIPLIAEYGPRLGDGAAHP